MKNDTKRVISLEWVKHVAWLTCDLCSDGGHVQVTSKINDPKLCYDGDKVKCTACGNQGEIYVEQWDNTAHAVWEHERALLTLTKDGDAEPWMTVTCCAYGGCGHDTKCVAIESDFEEFRAKNKDHFKSLFPSFGHYRVNYTKNEGSLLILKASKLTSAVCSVCGEDYKDIRVPD